MKAVLFYHSFVSCWNHGNAHFLRGVTRELIKLGHDVVVYEPEDGWSRTNALADGGAAVIAEAAALVLGVSLRCYRSGQLDLDQATDGADVVIVHEWNAPALIAALGNQRLAGAPFTLLFHDTHHRAVTAPTEMDALELDGYDADRKSTRLNSSHLVISYAVFCLKKKITVDCHATVAAAVAACATCHESASYMGMTPSMAIPGEVSTPGAYNAKHPTTSAAVTCDD